MKKIFGFLIITHRLLHELVEEKNTTVSDIVRMAILTYSSLNGKDIEIDKLEKYHELLYGGENVIVDIEIWDKRFTILLEGKI